MTTAADVPGWIPLKLLEQRCAANIAAVAKQYPALAEALRDFSPTRDYFIQSQQNRIRLGTGELHAIQPLPEVLSPGSAQATLAKLFPSGKCSESVLIAGEDLGWLWNGLYLLPCEMAGVPGHRPPLFFLCKDLERLWLMLHVQDWQNMLVDPRVKLFAGNDCIQQFRQSLYEDRICPWPNLSIDVTPGIWPETVTHTTILTEARAVQMSKLACLSVQLQQLSSRNTPQMLAERFSSGTPLKVLGISSCYTTFIQHSMRDWLHAFEQLGHITRLAIETADYKIANNLWFAEICTDFEPDLIVAIDHYRADLSGIPDGVPVVMWVQDALPKLFSPAAGAEQGPIDFAIGIASLRMVHQFGYPAERYQSAQIGVNEKRFTLPRTNGRKNFSCDVSFVSHASTPAEVLLQRALARQNSPRAVQFITQIFIQLKQIYTAGRMVTEPITIRRLIDTAMADHYIALPADEIQMVMDLFTAQINNAFFRHQSLQWLADAGVNLHLYGNGWEQHPTLSRFAKGPADNQNKLATIYAGSKINLHASPHGAAHQRVMEGLACGGFFMLRHCPGDIMERYFKPIHDFCQARGISTDAQLQQQADPTVRQLLDRIDETLQMSPFEEPWTFMEGLRSSELNGYIRAAGTIWADDYDAVSFNSAAELTAKVTHYLQNDEDRHHRAESMRQVVLERFTYTKITDRMLKFVSAGLRRNAANARQILSAAA